MQTLFGTELRKCAGKAADLIEGGDVQNVLHGVSALERHQGANLQLIICTLQQVNVRQAI